MFEFHNLIKKTNKGNEHNLREKHELKKVRERVRRQGKRLLLCMHSPCYKYSLSQNVAIRNMTH